jgi:outer membrane protein assembly factor BamE (lipoprotein component of BamABCDE complex)
MSKALYLTRVAVAGLVLVALTACSAVYRNHGYVPTDDELAQIAVGKDSRDSVREKIGEPSSAGMLNPAAWYYVESRWKYYGIRAPQEITREVVAISFTKAGKVENVERFGLKDGNVVALSRRVTTSDVKGIGFLKQMMGNLGNVRASDYLK